MSKIRNDNNRKINVASRVNRNTVIPPYPFAINIANLYERGDKYMAQRRMINKSIIISDDFIDMSAEARLLYFCLMLKADDDGVVANPIATARMAGVSVKNLQPLIDKGYLIELSGRMVIRHWRLHNHIREDWYRGTIHQEVWNHLRISENGTYEYCDKAE